MNVAPAFHEEWFCEESQNVLAGLVRDVSQIPGLIVEIGSWEGRSTVAMARAAHPRPVHACDTWNGSGAEISEQLAAERDVYGQWAANVAALTQGNVVEHRIGWRDYVPTITEPVALAFIDAEHSYREVYDNIRALLPKMSPGGILCGDDQHHPPVREALKDLLPADDVNVQYTMWWYRIPAHNGYVDQELPKEHIAELVASGRRLHHLHPDLAPSQEVFAAAHRELAEDHAAYVKTVSAPEHAMSLRAAAFLLLTCRALNARRVLDLGSGFSSYVLGLYAQQADHEVEVTSVDTDPKWLTATETFLVDRGVKSYVELLMLRDFDDTGFDVIFHDLANGEMREQTMPVALAALAPDGVAIFDDAHNYSHCQAIKHAAHNADMTAYGLHQWTLDDIKRFQMLVTKREPLSLAEQYERLCQADNDIRDHLPRFVAMVEELDAHNVLELGSRTGVSTVAWLHGLARTGGHLTTVDLSPAPPIGEHPNWTHIQGDDLDPEIVQKVAVPQPDIVFIDTSHHFQHTRRELATYRWVVKSGGVIVCHDTEVARPGDSPALDPLYPVKRAVEEFVAENGFEWVNYPECWGLAVIKVG